MAITLILGGEVGEHTQVSNVVNKFNFSIHENFSINEASFSQQGFVCHHYIQLLYMFVHFSCLTIPSVHIYLSVYPCILKQGQNVHEEKR